MLANLVEEGALKMPKANAMKARADTHRQHAAAVDSGQLGAQARMQMKVQEWMAKNLVTQQGGRRVLTAAKEEAMVTGVRLARQGVNTMV